MVAIVIVEKVNVKPPSVRIGMIEVLLVDETVKSETYPTVVPDGVRAAIVQLIRPFARCGLSAVQVSIELAVGIASVQLNPRYPTVQL